MLPRSAFLSLLMIFVQGALLAQGGGGHILSGIVREEAGNDPIPGVTLQILSSYGPAQPAVTSGMDGEFTFSGLDDGDYSLEATKTGYETATVSVTIMRTQTLPLTVSLRRIASSKPDAPANPVSAHELSAPPKARSAYEKGRQLLEQENKPADSIPDFQRAVDAFPTYYEAYTEMGVANYELNKGPEAEQAFKKAIDLSAGKFLNPIYLLADLYNNDAKYQQAESLARQAIDLDDGAWNGHFELARALVGLGNGPDAETSALRARDLNPKLPAIRIVLANVHLLEQNYTATLQDFDDFLSLEPSGPLSDVVRQNRQKLQERLKQASAANQQSPAPTH